MKKRKKIKKRKNINSKGIKLGILKQFMPKQYRSVIDGKIECNAESLIMDKISEVIADYYSAVNTSYLD